MTRVVSKSRRTDSLLSWFGFARSVAIYYGLPNRGRRLLRFYGGFVREGDLCFDVGAHVGNRLRALTRLGAQVVAIEPHPLFARFLRRAYGQRPGVSIVEQAVSAAPGHAELRSSSRSPTVSSISSEWIATVARADGFKRVQWDGSHPVSVTTLDELIATYGVPRFCKLDIEGSELQALQGLSVPIEWVSFEYLPAAIDSATGCLDRLSRLGGYEFNWTRGESLRLRSESWLSEPEMARKLQSLPTNQRSGDVYARLSDPDF